MNDRIYGIIGLTIITAACIFTGPEYAEKIVFMALTALVTLIRD